MVITKQTQKTWAKVAMMKQALSEKNFLLDLYETGSFKIKEMNQAEKDAFEAAKEKGWVNQSPKGDSARLNQKGRAYVEKKWKKDLEKSASPKKSNDPVLERKKRTLVRQLNLEVQGRLPSSDPISHRKVLVTPSNLVVPISIQSQSPEMGNLLVNWLWDNLGVTSEWNPHRQQLLVDRADVLNSHSL